MEIEIDVRPGWVPQTQADLPAFEQALDEALAQVRAEVLQLAQAKGVVYQDTAGVDSCFRRGLPGLFHNLARKFDRLETVAERLGFSRAPQAIAAEAAADHEREPETLYRTVRDLVVYGLHTMRWVAGEAQVRERGGG